MIPLFILSFTKARSHVALFLHHEPVLKGRCNHQKKEGKSYRLQGYLFHLTADINISCWRQNRRLIVSTTSLCGGDAVVTHILPASLARSLGIVVQDLRVTESATQVFSVFSHYLPQPGSRVNEEATERVQTLPLNCRAI
jgi:hypothetical protein